MVKKLLVFGIFCFLSSRGFSQDLIVRTNNDTIKAKVIEITVDKIKFRYNAKQHGPVLEIAKNLIKEIIYEDGSKLTIVFNPYEVSKDLYIHERAHAFKVDIVAPLLNHITIAYEFKLKMGKNLEFKAGLIKPYVWTQLNYAEGFFVRGVIKYVKLTDSYLKGLKYRHPLKGSYFKPEFIFGVYRRNEGNTKISYTNYGLNVIFGKQYILWNLFTLDYCGGLGVGIQSYTYAQDSITDKKDVDFNYAYSHLFFGKKIPIIITGGLTFGVVY
jgi:hypothetical protein